MDLPGVKRRMVIPQPVGNRETLAGWQLTSPFPRVTETGVNEETDISIRKVVHNQLSIDDEASASGVDHHSPNNLPLEEEVVVDMQQTRELQNCVTIREPGPLQKLSINMRREQSSCNAVDECADLQIVRTVEEPLKKKGYISCGADKDVIQLLDKMPSRGGVFLREQNVLHCDGGMYEEGRQYKAIPNNSSKGAFGEATMCQDMKTGKIFMRKTVKGKLYRNEIEVPLRLRNNKGIPEVYGVIIKDQEVEIFQEFAGLSLKALMESGSSYVKQLRDPKRVMVIAFQAFATLHKLHSQGITHQDIKPENFCLDIQPNGVWLLKYIDFGSSQTPTDQVIEGLTNEYLSPEACNTILQIARDNMPREAGRLGPGTDVWAIGLSLLYCLCGYHVMVYVCTRRPKYVELDPQKLQFLRMQCLLKIRSLTDEDIARELIRPEWPDALKTLLKNILRVDPNLRWSAQQAAEFIQNWIFKGAGMQQQPPAPVVASGTPAVASAVVAPAWTPAPPAVAAAAAAPKATASRPAFQGLAPARLLVQPRPQLQISMPQNWERASEGQAVQCTSPMSVGSPPASPPSLLDTPSTMQLPDFSDLLCNTTTKKSQRRSRGKQLRMEPYSPPARKNSKN